LPLSLLVAPLEHDVFSSFDASVIDSRSLAREGKQALPWDSPREAKGKRGERGPFTRRNWKRHTNASIHSSPISPTHPKRLLCIFLLLVEYFPILVAPFRQIDWLKIPSSKSQQESSTRSPLKDGVTTEASAVENTKRETMTSTLTLEVKREDDNATVVCQAQNAADPTPRSDAILLLVEFAPSVALTPEAMDENGDALVEENGTISFVCNATAKPARVTYRWFIGDDIVTGTDGSKLTLPSVNRNMNGKVVRCEVTNARGKSDATSTLSVHYAPKFHKKPRDFSGERGEEAKLHCEVNGNPPPVYTWFKNGDMKTVSQNECNVNRRLSRPSTALSRLALPRPDAPAGRRTLRKYYFVPRGPQRRPGRVHAPRSAHMREEGGAGQAGCG